MGAWVSVLLGMDGAEAEAAAAAAGAGPAAVGLGDLPELCAAQVLLRLDPPEICRLARLNHAFRGAAGADFVWEAKLPENCAGARPSYLMEFLDVGARLCGQRQGYGGATPLTRSATTKSQPDGISKNAQKSTESAIFCHLYLPIQLAKI